MTQSRIHRASERGFSLLEITIVLAIMAVVLAGVLPYITESTRSKDAEETISRMDAIEEALLSYYLADATNPGTLPCPTDITKPLGDPDFGVAIPNGSCNTGGVYTVIDNGDLRAGGVPTQTLGLADEMAFDGWGRRFTYYIDQRATNTASLTNANLTVDGDLDLTTVLSNTIAYVIVSHGPNGHGAYERSGNFLDQGSLNVEELENCAMATGCVFDDRFIKRSIGYGNPAVADDNDFYDDVMRFKPWILVQNAYGGSGGGGGGSALIDPTNCTDGEDIKWDATNSVGRCDP
jgi:prepilin-type N-terminal cleavage/methylation domain-containing protein